MATKERCAESVYHSEGNWGRSAQCARKSGFGPDEKYCHQHAEKFAEGKTTTWYRVDSYSEYSFGVQQVRVLKETETSLLIKSGATASRESKKSAFYRYFPTLKQAMDFYRNQIAGLRAKADNLQRKLDAEINHRAGESK